MCRWVSKLTVPDFVENLSFSVIFIETVIRSSQIKTEHPLQSDNGIYFIQN